MKIAISGAHGSGKTRICKGLVEKLKEMGLDVALVPEAARESKHLLAGKQSIYAQLEIFGTQIKNEMAYLLNAPILVTDRSIIDQLMYMELFFPEEKELFNSQTDFCRVYMKTYDYVFKTSTLYDPNKIKDELRPKDLELQRKANENIARYLEKFYPNYIEIPKNLDRFDKIEFILEQLDL